MYSYRNSTKNKQQASLVPNRLFSQQKPIQLVDNRKESIVQRKLQKTMQSTTSTTEVIQLGKKQNVAIPTKRPGFTTDTKISATLFHNLINKSNFKIKLKKPGLPALNLAQPHRISWKDILTNTSKYHLNKNTLTFLRMNMAFVQAGNERIQNIKNKQKSDKTKNLKSSYIDLLKRAESSQTKFEKALKDYKKNKNSKNIKEYLRLANSFHANVPDYGPHFGVNNPVSAAMHLNFVPSKTRKPTKKVKRPRSPSPMTRSLLENIKKNDVSEGVAVDIHGNYITPSGETFSLNDLSTTNRSRLSKFRKKTINSFDPNTVFGPSYVKPPKKKVKKNTTAKLKKKIVKKVKKKKVKKKSH